MSGSQEQSSKGETQAEKSRKSQEKRMRMRNLLALTNPSIVDINVPEAIRKVSPQLLDKGEALRVKARTVSEESSKLGGSSEQTAREYVATRAEFAKETSQYCREVRTLVNQLDSSQQIDKTSAKRMRDETEDIESTVSKERALAATNRAKLTFGTLHHATHHKLGEAYLAAIVDNLKVPPHAGIELFPRSGSDNSAFKERVLEAYKVPNPPVETGWCPISRDWVRSAYLRAGHIVPYAVGELNASYIFGAPPEEGWKIIWDTTNGMQMEATVEKAFDEARFVVVPCCDDEEGDLKMVVLDDSILGKRTGSDLSYEELNERPIEFRTSARPSLRFLFLHCLMAVFRRRRFAVPGWERDCEKVIKGRVWFMSGDWLRRGVLQALAHEVGDIGSLSGEYEEVASEQNGVRDDLPGQRDSQHDERVAVGIRGAWETHIDREEWVSLREELIEEDIMG